jgi:hypothetical protein
LSFRTGLLSLSPLSFLKKNEDDVSTISNIYFYIDNSVCIRQGIKINTCNEEDILCVYEKVSGNLRKVLSLSTLELRALYNMADYLQARHGLTDSNQLRSLLIPVIRKGCHISRDNEVNGRASSRSGYYTKYGYCNLKIQVYGNCVRSNVFLLDHNKNITYKNSFSQTFS